MKKALLILLGLLFAISALAETDTAALQQRLIETGYLEGTADGIWGEETETALSQLRSDLSLSESDPLPAEFSGVNGMVAENEQSFYALRIQRRLCQLGYLAGTADGVFGVSSMKALRIFKNDCGETEDEAALAVLFSASAPTAAYPALTLTDKGENVLLLQQKLILSGFLDDIADGQFGKATAKGVKNLQTYLNKTNESYAALSQGETDGVADSALLAIFLAEDFPVAPEPSKSGYEGMDVRRLQIRLSNLGYLSASPDGGFGDATKKAVGTFQKRNGIKATGKADAKTLALLCSEEAKAALLPYRIEIDQSAQRVYVYEAGENEAYTTLVHTFVCSAYCTAGTYDQTAPVEEEWQTFSNGKAARYVFKLNDTISIHSTWFDAIDGNADRESVAMLGTALAGNDILLSEPDAQWIWEKCPKRTVFIIR